MSAVSLPGQLVARHLASLAARTPLLLDCPDPGLAGALDARPDAAPCVCLHRDRAAWRSFREAGRAAGWGAWLEPAAGPFDGAVLFLPKGRDLIAMTLEMAATALAADAVVWLVGANTAGIRSSRTELEAAIGPVLRVETARHCALLEARRSRPAQPARPLADRAVRFTVAALGRDLTVATLPGVFSHGALDAGTRMLLDTLKPEAAGRILDFGCGSGVIGAALAAASSDAEVHFADSSALALEATRLTLAANGLSAAHVFPTDGVDGVEGPYDLIVSNPPFHTGVETDRGIAERFVRAAPPLLARGGRIRLVANRFLRYAPLLEEVFTHVRVLAEDERYQVVEAKRR